jgi:hypothetical protein
LTLQADARFNVKLVVVGPATPRGNDHAADPGEIASTYIGH